MVEDGVFSHKIDYVPIVLKNLNLEENLNRFVGSKVTARGWTSKILLRYDTITDLNFLGKCP